VKEVLPHFWAGVQFLLLPGLVVTLFVVLPASFALKRLSPVTLREGVILLTGLAFCGYIVGVIGGNSEAPIAQTIVTGVIGVIAGLVAYVHTKETTKTTGLRTMASLGLVALLMALLLGLIAGGAYKRRFEPYKQAAERYNIYFKQLAIPLCLEERKLLLAGKPAQSVHSACPSVDQGIAVRQ